MKKKSRLLLNLTHKDKHLKLKLNISRSALKIVNNLIMDENEKEKQIQEISLLKRFQNMFIVKYIDHFEYKNRFCIVTELFRVFFA